MNKISFTVEDLRFNPPSFSIERLREALKISYGLTGSLRPLAGERDQNHLLETSDNRSYVLKVAGPDEDRSVVDYQIKVLQHIETKNPALNIPRNLKTLKGEDFAIIRSSSGQQHMMRLLSFVDGVPFGKSYQPSHMIIHAAGRFQGQMCKALADFSHPSEGYFMPWDISQGLAISPALLRSKYGDVERLVLPLVDHFKDHVLPKMQLLRKQTIHNDAHTGNMLKSAQGVDEFYGMIDFGDIVHAPLVQDLAIPMTRFISGAQNPIAAGRAYVKGFSGTYPLLRDELDILYDLILLRACLTIQLIDFRIANNDANQAELVEVYPSLVIMVEKLLSFDSDAMTAAFHDAVKEAR